MQIMIQSYT